MTALTAAAAVLDRPPSARRIVVERSATGRRWLETDIDDRLNFDLCRAHDLPDMVGRLLLARGVEGDDVPAFLEPRLRNSLPDPSRVADMDKAAGIIADALVAGEIIGIIADYDVDGTSSAALLARYLKAIGARHALRIPERMQDGYGPSDRLMADLADAGARLVLVLDSGTTAFEVIAQANARGQQVIVVDHHTPDDRLPDAAAIVNPNRRDDRSNLGSLAAVGVTFLLLVALNREARRRGFFASRPEPDLRSCLDLVAFGTVCDMVSLTGLNRVFVSQGLKIANGTARAGLKALASISRQKGRVTTESFGFAYGPRINAAGRLDHALISAKLLMTDDEEEAEALAQQLEALNLERRRLEREATTQAERALKDQIGAVALGVHPDWHPGVLGIVAGRLVERLHKPVLLAGQEEDLVKGSGRSVPGFDLGGALVDAQRKGLALKAGGHPMAGGFTVRSDHLDAFRAHLETWPAGAPEPPSLALDGTLMVAGASLNLALSLEKLAPFGQDHQVPRFRIRDASVVHVQEVGKQHLRCQVRGPDGSRLEAIAFRCLGTELGRALQDWRGGPPCQLAGKLSVDRYRGFERAHFMIEDLATAEA